MKNPLPPACNRWPGGGGSTVGISPYQPDQPSGNLDASQAGRSPHGEGGPFSVSAPVDREASDRRAIEAPRYEARRGGADLPAGSGASTDARASDPEDLRTAWTSLLDRWAWDLFATFTFREDVHPERAFKAFRVFLSIVNRKLYGLRWHKHGQGVRWVLAMERQRRGVVHFHALLSSAELVELLRSSWRPEAGGRWGNDVLEIWNSLAGFARIERIHSSAAVRGYVSKYVLKGGEIELGGPGMPEFQWKGHPMRVDRAWLTTTMGRATSKAILEACATREEFAALLAYAERVPGSRRATAALRASLRARMRRGAVTSGPSIELRPDRSLIGM